MTNKPDFDVGAAHKYFAVSCFNGAWDLIDKPERTAAEDEEMLRLAMASVWHWTQQEDCTPTNVSVGYWQVSRVYAILKRAEDARRYGQLSLETSQAEGVGPFYRGYAFEALARAEAVAGNRIQMESYLSRAQQLADAIPDADAKKMLLDDLKTIG